MIHSRSSTTNANFKHSFHVMILSLFMEKKGVKAQVIELFGRNFVHFSSGVADTLYEWMMDTRDHFISAGYDAFN